MSVHAKLLKVQSKLNAPKTQYNQFGKYHYRNCEDIQEAVKPLLEEVSAVLIVGDELVQIADRYYIKATAKFIDCESGEEVFNTAYAREELEKKGMDVSQVTGSTSSYARKYALNGLFCIDDVKDPDNHDNTNKDKKQTDSIKTNQQSKGIPKTGKPADPQNKDPENNEKEAAKAKIDQAKINVIKGELERTGLEETVVLNLFGAKELKDLNTEQFMTVMKKFKVTPDKEA